jgi:hypothetical protein
MGRSREAARGLGEGWREGVGSRCWLSNGWRTSRIPPLAASALTARPPPPPSPPPHPPAPPTPPRTSLTAGGHTPTTSSTRLSSRVGPGEGRGGAFRAGVCAACARARAPLLAEPALNRSCLVPAVSRPPRHALPDARPSIPHQLPCSPLNPRPPPAGIFAVARRFFLLFQMHANYACAPAVSRTLGHVSCRRGARGGQGGGGQGARLEPAPAASLLPRPLLTPRFHPHPHPHPHPPCQLAYHQVRSIGPSAVLVSPDTRSQRTTNQVGAARLPGSTGRGRRGPGRSTQPPKAGSTAELGPPHGPPPLPPVAPPTPPPRW